MLLTLTCMIWRITIKLSARRCWYRQAVILNVNQVFLSTSKVLISVEVTAFSTFTRKKFISTLIRYCILKRTKWTNATNVSIQTSSDRVGVLAWKCWWSCRQTTRSLKMLQIWTTAFPSSKLKWTNRFLKKFMISRLELLSLTNFLATLRLTLQNFSVATVVFR